jgi:hypothetical protein
MLFQYAYRVPSSTECEMYSPPDRPCHLRNVEQRRTEITALGLLLPGELIERRTRRSIQEDMGPPMRIRRV